jgi:Fe(3+) dicitrate transport protein
MNSPSSHRQRTVVTRFISITCALPQALAQTAPEALPTVEVIGTRERLDTIAGSGELITADDLQRLRPLTTNEALRRSAGVHARDEEGFGLRPNIGLRGLNPTRSTKLTLLEDGVPLAYGPYGDNASYYHPPIDRYERIEVLKGANSLAFGPQTISGVVNYVSPAPPHEFEGFVAAAAGSRDYRNARARVGGAGWLVDYVRKQGDGARDNLEHALDDLNLKFVAAPSDEHAFTIRANGYREDSVVTYSGLTEAEFARRGARYNPFANDEFDAQRLGASLTYEWTTRERLTLRTTAYWSQFDRDWWRQSSTTTDTQCGAAFTAARLAGLLVDPDDCNSVQGRLRSYSLYGVEPRLEFRSGLGQLEAGLKLHAETQQRLQVNGRAPDARTGTTVEDSLRDTTAQSAFVSHRFDLGDWAVTPILRYERTTAERENRLVAGPRGRTRISEALPGIGLTWKPSESITAFASWHEGFAPPRVEDLVDGSGTATEVDAEHSKNLELGLRARPAPGISLQFAWFRNDFDNLIAVGSIAGGSTPLSQGEALYAGVELSAQAELGSGLYGALAFTWLDQAEQTTAFRIVANGATVGVAGNRQPYAPERTAMLTAGYAAGSFSLQLEAQYVGAQHSDFANTVAPTSDGQRGLIDAHTVVGATANFRLDETWSAFVALKNLGDDTYVVDRTRGIQVGQPRLLQVGFQLDF